jgi:hypothetical protein
VESLEIKQMIPLIFFVLKTYKIVTDRRKEMKKGICCEKYALTSGEKGCSSSTLTSLE